MNRATFKPGFPALVFVFYGACAHAVQQGGSVEELKQLGIAQCKVMGTQDARLSCVVDLANSLKSVESAAKSPIGHKVINGCSRLSMSAEVGVDAISLFKCVEQQLPIHEQHPFGQWVDAFFALPEFRAEWVARCHKQNSGNVTRCVQIQEVGFMQFWQEYSHLNQGQFSKFEAIARCVGGNLFQYDFSSYQSCPR